MPLRLPPNRRRQSEQKIALILRCRRRTYADGSRPAITSDHQTARYKSAFSFQPTPSHNHRHHCKTRQYHFATAALYRVNFDFGRCLRHHDDGAATQILRRQSHTLRGMVTRALRQQSRRNPRLFSAASGILLYAPRIFERKKKTPAANFALEQKTC